MRPDDLIEFRNRIIARKASLLQQIDDLAIAADDVESTDHRSDAFAKAVFLRAFTAYESDVERLFLHYVTGGLSIGGVQANTYLRVTDEEQARKLTRAGFRFLSWAKPQEIKNIAENYMENGWPINDMINARSQELSDCEKIRNRIAHNSLEALIGFNGVQRNLLATERLFPICPGQLLRVRNARLRKQHISHYIETMNSTLEYIIDPPP